MEGKNQKNFGRFLRCNFALITVDPRLLDPVIRTFVPKLIDPTIIISLSLVPPDGISQQISGITKKRSA